MRLINYIQKYFNAELMQDLGSVRTKFFLLLFNLIPDFYTLRFIKNIFLKLGGAKLPVIACYIRTPFYCNNLSNLYLGQNVFINRLVNIDGGGPVTVGDNVNIGPMVCIENINHKRNKDLEKSSVKIGHHVWIGAGCVVVPNSTIADQIVVAAGSVVRGELSQSNSLYAGVPAILKKPLS